MTEKTKNNTAEDSALNYHKLSIQISLNGLSFCILDTIGNKIEKADSITFTKELTPYEVQKRLKEIFTKHRVTNYSYSEVVVVHRNNLFTLVPKAIFDEKELVNYLKFNTKILANDLISFDEIESYDIVNVYVPFVNINNYIYELFGEFTYMHNGTVMIQSLLSTQSNGKETVCYAHISGQQLDITVISEKKLLFYNSFNYNTKEDFIYYLLFTFEQLKLDSDTTKLRLFGTINENDEIYNLCYSYVNNISIYIPASNTFIFDKTEEDSGIDFTILNTL
ncbi:MAG: DUF3822 family protein [Cellulophaga sp.]